MAQLIDTDRWSYQWRERGIDLDAAKVLVTNFLGTEQEPDLNDPPNCRGLGRIRHFKRTTSPGWPCNPLPIDPACKALGLKRVDRLRAQVFQNAVCNWRCWYCFVPFPLLSANPQYSEWVTASDLMDLYLGQIDRPVMIDLSGGQPDLTPEWVPWMLKEIRERHLEGTVYLWSDDNLSNDYFWQYLSEADIDLVSSARNYGRVCCFKGFDSESFSFNTQAEEHLFDRQFELFGRFVELGIDIYAYVTLTSPTSVRIADRIRRFVDRLQAVHENLPLRTVPLEVRLFTPVHGRLKEDHRRAFDNQVLAIEAWNETIAELYAVSDRVAPITEIPLNR